MGVVFKFPDHSLWVHAWEMLRWQPTIESNVIDTDKVAIHCEQYDENLTFNKVTLAATS